MSNLVTSNAIESALIKNDLSLLTADQRISYYKNFCESVGLNSLTQPLAYITLNGKLTLYAKKDATDQLRSIKKISITKLDIRETSDTYEVTAYGKNDEGREDSDMGIVDITGLKGDKLANAKLKAVTKAKRRLTLSLSGLGLLDETEIETIQDAKEPVANPFEAGKIEVEKGAYDPGLYEVKFGQFKGARLKDLDIHQLNNYCEYIRKSAIEKNKPLQGQVLEFIEIAELYLNSKEVDKDEIPF